MDDREKYLVAGGSRLGRIILGDGFRIKDIRDRIDRIERQKIKKITRLLKKCAKGPKGEYLTKIVNIWSEYSNELDNLFPGYSAKGSQLLNLEYVRSFKDWKLLWPLVKVLQIFAGQWERFVKYRWGERSGERRRIDLRNEIAWQVIKKLKRKRTKVRDMIRPINAKIDNEKKLGNPEKRSYYHVTEGILRQIIHKQRL